MHSAIRRAATLAAATVSLFAVVALSPAQASTMASPTRPTQVNRVVADSFTWVNFASKKCLDHENGGTGLYAIVFDCNRFPNQQWSIKLVTDDGAYEIRNAANSKCLDRENSGTGLRAIVFNCNGAANQRWFIEPTSNGTWKIENAGSRRCLDHESSGTGLYAIVFICNGSNNQRWI